MTVKQYSCAIITLLCFALLVADTTLIVVDKKHREEVDLAWVAGFNLGREAVEREAIEAGVAHYEPWGEICTTPTITWHSEPDLDPVDEIINFNLGLDFRRSQRLHVEKIDAGMVDGDAVLRLTGTDRSVTVFIEPGHDYLFQVQPSNRISGLAEVAGTETKDSSNHD